MNFHKKLIDELKAIRKLKKLTQANVAEKMNTTASAVARFELYGGKRNHSPSLKTLAAYTQAIGVEIEINVKVKLIKYQAQCMGLGGFPGEVNND